MKGDTRIKATEMLPVRNNHFTCINSCKTWWRVADTRHMQTRCPGKAGGGSTVKCFLGQVGLRRDSKTPLFSLVEYTEHRLIKCLLSCLGAWAYYLTFLSIAFFICKMGNKVTWGTEFWRVWNERIYIKHLVQYLAHSRCSADSTDAPICSTAHPD